MRLAAGVLGHLHQLEHLFHPGIDLRLGQAILLEAEGDVLGHRHVGEQGIGLEHHVDGAFIGRHVGNVDAVEEQPSFRGSLEPGQHPQQGGLAGAGPTQQGEDLALVDVERHVVDRQRFVELLAYPVYFDQHFFTLLAALEGFLVGTGGYRHYQTPKGDSGLGRSINTIWRPGMGAKVRFRI